jgi:hypothetical protein
VAQRALRESRKDSNDKRENNVRIKALQIKEERGRVCDVFSKLTWKEGFLEHKLIYMLHSECHCSSYNISIVLPQCYYGVFAVYLGLSLNSNSNPLYRILLNQAIFATCKETLNFLIQLSQSEFTVLKIMSKKIFGEFTIFFSKGLNPFKIQIGFAPEFYNSKSRGIWKLGQI